VNRELVFMSDDSRFMKSSIELLTVQVSDTTEAQ